MHGSNMVLWGLNGRRSCSHRLVIKLGRGKDAMSPQREIPFGLIVCSLSGCAPCAVVKSGLQFRGA